MKLVDTKLWRRFQDSGLLYTLYRKTIGSLIRKGRMAGRKDAVKTQGTDCIREIHSVLDGSGVLFFVDAGTLLGFIREGRLLKWDFDVDFGVVVEGPETWTRLGRCLTSSGYKLIKQFRVDGSVMEQTYGKNGLSIDFFGHFNVAETSVQYSFYNPTNHPTNEMAVMEFSSTRISGISKLPLDEITVNIPDNTERYLADSYGENWRIPDPSWDYRNSPGYRLRPDKHGIREDF